MRATAKPTTATGRGARILILAALVVLGVVASPSDVARAAPELEPEPTMLLAQATPKAKKAKPKPKANASKAKTKGGKRRAGPRPRASDGSSALPQVGPMIPSTPTQLKESVEPRSPRATGAKTPKRRPSPRRATSKSSTEPLDVAARGALLLVFGGLYVHWRRTSRSLHTPGRESDSGFPEFAAPLVQHVARPVFLEPHNEIDPATRNVTDIFQRPDGAGEAVRPVPEAYEDSNDLAAEDLEAIAQIRIASGLKPIRGGEARASLDSPLVLPSTLAAHFRGVPGEQLAWTGHLTLPVMIEGTLAITNERLLACYQRRMLDLLPPSWINDYRRHQVAISAVTGYDTVQARRPSILAVGAALCLWWPFGSAAAVASIALFFFWTRAELAVDFGASRRQYPLSPEGLETARSALASQMSRKAQKSAVQPGKKVV